MPDEMNIRIDFNTSEVNTVLNFTKCYQNKTKDKLECNHTLYKEFILDQKIIFVQRVRESLKHYHKEVIYEIDKNLSISKREINPEVLAVWLEIMVATQNHNSVQEEVKKFLKRYGRMKYIIPIYAAYYRADKKRARELFDELKKHYHPIAIERIERLFKN